jgi:prepilin-type N-terminal cleavage/methylation domain-containing protein
MTTNRTRTQRGTTIIELMVAMLLLSVVMSLAAFEFRDVIQQHYFVESHLTAEQQARIAMSDIMTSARQASVDITDYPFPEQPPPPVEQPANTPGPVLEFTQVSQLQNLQQGQFNGQPQPCYVDVTISFETPAPGKVYGSIVQHTAYKSAPCANYTLPQDTTFARNVAVLPNGNPGFQVSLIKGQGSGLNYGNAYDITLIVQSLLPTKSQDPPAQFALTSRLTPLIFGINN